MTSELAITGLPKRFSIPPRAKSSERSGQSCDIARHRHRLLEIWRTQDAADKDLEGAADKAKYLGDLRVKFLAALKKENPGSAQGSRPADQTFKVERAG